MVYSLGNNFWAFAADQPVQSTLYDSPPTESAWFGEAESTRKSKWKKAGHNDQLGTTTPAVVFVHVAPMWRVIQPETEDQALSDGFFFVTLSG